MKPKNREGCSPASGGRRTDHRGWTSLGIALKSLRVRETQFRQNVLCIFKLFLEPDMRSLIALLFRLMYYISPVSYLRSNSNEEGPATGSEEDTTRVRVSQESPR